MTLTPDKSVQGKSAVSLLENRIAELKGDLAVCTLYEVDKYQKAIFEMERALEWVRNDESAAIVAALQEVMEEVKARYPNSIFSNRMLNAVWDILQHQINKIQG
jgi:hypothetical protein